jgi:hypothetical protein
MRTLGLDIGVVPCLLYGRLAFKAEMVKVSERVLLPLPVLTGSWSG